MTNRRPGPGYERSFIAKPHVYMCQQGCGEVVVEHVHIERQATADRAAAPGPVYYHYADGTRHAVTREQNREGLQDAPTPDAEAGGEKHGPEGR